MGYFLPEESQLRLKKLHEYAQFLSHMAQPRTAAVEQERMPEIRVGEVAICLELLAEQIGLMLDDLSFPACRGESTAASAACAMPGTAHAMPGDSGERYLVGMTRAQVDALHKRIDRISAHGDVVTVSHGAELAGHTLSLLGHAIVNDVRAVRDIIQQVESQRLMPPRHPPNGVSEERAVYRVARKRARVHWTKSASTGRIPWRVVNNGI